MKAVFRIILSSALITGTMTQCNMLGTEPEPVAINLNEEFAQATTEFSFDFLKKLEQEEVGENFFVSPLSLHMALGMLLNGSGTASEEQLLKTLKLEGMDKNTINESYTNLITNLPNVDPKVKNLLANSVWQRQGFSVTRSCQRYLKRKSMKSPLILLH